MIGQDLRILIEKFFPTKESERIMKLIENEGDMERNASSSEYKLTLRAINKLRNANKLLEFPEIQNIVEVKRRKV